MQHVDQLSARSHALELCSHSSQTALTQRTARKLALCRPPIATQPHCGPAAPQALGLGIASVLQPLAQDRRKRPIPPADVRIASASDECRYSAARDSSQRGLARAVLRISLPLAHPRPSLAQSLQIRTERTVAYCAEFWYCNRQASPLASPSTCLQGWPIGSQATRPHRAWLRVRRQHHHGSGDGWTSTASSRRRLGWRTAAACRTRCRCATRFNCWWPPGTRRRTGRATRAATTRGTAGATAARRATGTRRSRRDDLVRRRRRSSASTTRA